MCIRDRYPTPYRYEDVFKDVLIVKKDAPEMTILRWSLDGWYESNEYPQAFAAGDRIECRARGTEGGVSDPELCSGDPETSRFIVAVDAVCDKVKEDAGMHPTLIFEREDVELTGEPWDWLDELDGTYERPKGIIFDEE